MNHTCKLTIIIAAVLAWAQPSAGFTLISGSDPTMQGWPSHDITFNVNSSNCPASIDVPGLINEAAKVWNNVATSNVKASYGTTTTSTAGGSPPVVYCETNFQSVVGADQNYVPGAALVGSPPTGGNLATARLVLNVSVGSANITRFDQTKLLIILAHEIGHVLGLGHSQDSSALMYYNASAKTNLLLSQDDIDGISYLYPRDELSGDPMMGCGVVKSVRPPNPPTASALWILALLLMPIAVALGMRGRPDRGPRATQLANR